VWFGPGSVGPRRVLLLAAFVIGISHAARSETSPDADATSSAIAGNPGAVNIVAGTGELGQQLGVEPEAGLRLGGVLVSNGNYLISGGNFSGTTSFNNMLVADLDADLEKLAHIPGASLGAALLRFDGQPTNRQAGYNGLTGAPPLDRRELYELWWRQSFFADKLLEVAPVFNGYRFQIGETGAAWLLGTDNLPGAFAIGAWDQTGTLTLSRPQGAVTQNGIHGVYAFASQRLWRGSLNGDAHGIYPGSYSWAPTTPGR